MKIKSKIYLTILLNLIVFGLITVFYLTSNFKTNFIAQRKIYGIGILNGFIKDLNFGVAIKNKEYLKKIANELVKINFINGVEIYVDKQLILEIDKNKSKECCKIEKISYMPETKYKISLSSNKKQKEIYSKQKVKYVIFLDLSDFEKIFSNYLRDISVIIVILVIITFFLISFFIEKFLKPLSELSEAVSKMKYFKFFKITGNYPPELTPFVDTFNEFVDEINSKTKELNEKVQELGKTNNELQKKMAEIESLQRIVFNNEKLASIGTMAAGVAHEINNPLAGIVGLIELQMYSDKNNNNRKIYVKILENCKRISEVVKKLKGYSSVNNEKHNFLLKNIIEDAIDILKHSKKIENITVKGNYKNSDVYLNCKRNEIIQLLTNLIENSVHACKGDGTVEINIYDKPEDIEIFYSDSGPGIPEEIRDKIFESFFTTKKGNMGTGLGLYISKKIVEELKGKIESVYKKGKGACFRITFPKQGDNNDKINTDS